MKQKFDNKKRLNIVSDLLLLFMLLLFLYFEINNNCNNK